MEIKIDIPNILSTFNAELQKEINAAAKKTAKDTVKALKEKSPKKTGKYAGGWTADVDSGILGAQVVVHNKDKYQLTHLLEKGHRLVGKKGGLVAAKAHIAPVEQEMIKRYTDEAIKVVERAAGKC
ncbi:MAG: HK97 gp10 family phage protein [Candidatus Ornithomonoglobus sp.]